MNNRSIVINNIRFEIVIIENGSCSNCYFHGKNCPKIPCIDNDTYYIFKPFFVKLLKIL